MASLRLIYSSLHESMETWVVRSEVRKERERDRRNIVERRMGGNRETEREEFKNDRRERKKQ